MKKASLAALVFLLLMSPAFVGTPNVRASTVENLYATYVSSDVPDEQLPSNFTTEDYLNTTNPYSDLNMTEPLSAVEEEVHEVEGSHPLCVLVAGDEEERGKSRVLITWDGIQTLDWKEYAKLQLERGDESLVANFGIDIRILGFIEWGSYDGYDSMYDLWDELERDTGQYLRQWFEGELMSGIVDAVIGITGQETTATETLRGLSPKPFLLDQGETFSLLKWKNYWMDDNLVQHEVSHLYYAPDHEGDQPPEPCCAMSYHTHYWTYVNNVEDGFWWIFSDVRCAFTSYFWCADCYETMLQNSGLYPMYGLTIPTSSRGKTDPVNGTTYYRGIGFNFTVTANANYGCTFSYWLLDGTQVYGNPVTVTMDSDHFLEAHFALVEPLCALKTNTSGRFYVPNATFVNVTALRIEKLFDNTNLTGDQTGPSGTSPYPAITRYPDGKVDTRDVSFVSQKFQESCNDEGDAGWDYMADVYPDRKIDVRDVAIVAKNFGRPPGSYTNDTTNVVVHFDTDDYVWADANGFFVIPQGATSFNVTISLPDNPIGAMVLFCRP